MAIDPLDGLFKGATSEGAKTGQFVEGNGTPKRKGRRLINDKKNGIHVVQDNLDDLKETLRALAMREVLVGVPAENDERPAVDGKPSPVTNAVLAYVHDNGDPARNIPARPFMYPGMKAAEGQVTDLLARTAKYVLGGRPGKLEEGLARVGMAAVKGIQDVIRAGIPPPLADATLRARARRGRKGAQNEIFWRRNEGAPSMQWAIPLMDTNEMFKSITWVTRDRRQRSSK